MADIKGLLAERGARYGTFERNAEIMQDMKRALRESPSWDKMTDSMREALEMSVHKMGRIVGGDPYCLDNWLDAIGYLQLVVDELEAVMPAETQADVKSA